jgi:hypothetical protein
LLPRSGVADPLDAFGFRRRLVLGGIEPGISGDEARYTSSSAACTSVFCWPNEGELRILTDAEVRRDYERIEDRATNGHRATSRAGASALLYMERDGGMCYPVRSSDVATLCALQRAGRWVTSAAVTGERADCCDSSLDRVASSLGSGRRRTGRAQTEPAAESKTAPLMCERRRRRRRRVTRRDCRRGNYHACEARRRR